MTETENFERELSEILQSETSFYKKEEPMSRHTTFRAGGPAQYFAAPSGQEELAGLLRLCSRYGFSWRILGNGSNLLVSDSGLRELVISMEPNWSYGNVEGDRLRAGAGLLLSRAASLALKHSLAGLEFAAGIPGTLGGAVVMNAGAYGSELKDVLEEVLVMDGQGQVRLLKAEELELGYRTSCIPARGYLVLEGVLRLRQGQEDQIRARMNELAAKRREKQPLEYPSAGSTFKRPEGYFAGKLIEDAGLKGFSLGGAQVSEKHAGFVINRSQATAAELYDLCRQVQEEVFKQAGVRLELEVKLWGDF